MSARGDHGAWKKMKFSQTSQMGYVVGHEHDMFIKKVSCVNQNMTRTH